MASSKVLNRRDLGTMNCAVFLLASCYQTPKLCGYLSVANSVLLPRRVFGKLLVLPGILELYLIAVDVLTGLSLSNIQSLKISSMPNLGDLENCCFTVGPPYNSFMSATYLFNAIE